MNLNVGFSPFRTDQFPFTYFNLEVFRQDMRRYQLLALNSIFIHQIWGLSWNVTSCSPEKVNWHFGGTYSLYLQNREVIPAVLAAWFMPVSCLAYSTTWWWLQYAPLKCMSAGFHQTTQHYIPEERILSVFIHLNLNVLYHSIMKFYYLH
jgi:hypothetical protein